jgi:uncharacterized protein (DUF169 family)
MDNKNLSATLKDSLGLELPPVALGFRDAAPAGVTESTEVVPSACAFWREAEKGVFFASVERHANCPIGAFVMGFELSEALMGELMGLVGQMTACGYVHKDEAGKIPTNRRKARGIVYGPLGDFPGTPDVVLLWLTPSQAMIWSEANGGAAWDAAPSTVFGRPACAAIPAAMDAEAPRLSLGCMGMRTFTRIPQDRMLAVIPGAKLADFVAALGGATRVNATMRDFYEGRLAALHG